MQTKKKNEQLKMDVGTAQSQLKQMILWSLLQETGRTKCFVCKEEMSLETFSIEHMEPWLDKENAIELFFNLQNISFSHLTCNISRRSKGSQSFHGTETRYIYGCRCELCKKAHANYRRERYTKEKRKEKYLRTGK